MGTVLTDSFWEVIPSIRDRRRYVFVAKTLGALLSEQSIVWQVRNTLSEIRVSSDVAP